MKKLIPAYILSFVISFMLFLYEPITMYANNINDFWFDIYTMFFPIMIMFLSSFICLSLLFTLIYYINKKFNNKLYVYNISIIIVFIIFIALYIQGNYLAGNLPALSGEKINWSNYTKDAIISGVLWLIVTISMIVLTIKFKFKNIIKYIKYISEAIFVMLFISLISTILTNNTFIHKLAISSTNKNINTISTDKNLLIFLVDAADSVDFEKAMNDSEYKNTFEDFTYYPDTLAAYPFTRDSIPFILSGIWNENETDFITYYKNALDNSKLIEKLKEKKYDINIYDYEMKWDSIKAKDVSNLTDTSPKINKKKFIKQQTKYILFRYLPYPFKKYSKIETMKFDACKVKQKEDYFSWSNKNAYKIINDNKLETTKDKYFQFIHIEGAHVPFNVDENLNSIKNGTYDQKLKATLKVINAYINRLKENSVYDNSAIMVLADHGFNVNDKTDSQEGRQNPILFIKGIDEHHKMIKSELPISYEDLNEAYFDLLDGKKSEELFKNIDINRKRRFLWYKYKKENKMVEYEQTGKAWDEDTMIKTGKEFNR